MNRILPIIVAASLLLKFNQSLSTVLAQGTAFTYQGQLQNNGSLASGSYNLQFVLYTNASAGTAVAGPVTNNAVAVTNGLFTVTMDFGSEPWNGQSNWLQVAVETNSSGATFSTLTPRQPMTPVPYAIYAESGGTAIALANGAALGSGSSDSIATGVNDAFIGGGLDNMVQSGASYAFIGGGWGNSASGIGSFIGGGGFDGNNIYGNSNQGNAAGIVGGLGNVIQTNANYAFIGGGIFNTVSGPSATIGGGTYNIASGNIATVGGGTRNIVSGDSATVSGGRLNSASGAGSFIGGGGFDGATWDGNDNQGNAAVIVGGWGNIVQIGADYSFIGGGYQNTASAGYGTVVGGLGNTARGTYATVCGGIGNLATGMGSFIGGGGYGFLGAGNVNWGTSSTIGGGAANTILIGASYAFIGGGANNNASGVCTTVPGGYDNTAGGQCSFAAGNSAFATNDYAFVWSDGSTNTVSTKTNQFVARASGGFYFYTSRRSVGAELPAGSGSWNSMSDRNAKDDFVTVNPETVLASVAALPMTTWSYKAEHGVRHIGPMAQDFYAAFNVGEDDRHIADVDESGVALAAIQALNQKLDKEHSENDELRRQLDELRAEVKILEQHSH